eukprot:COSAG02_NODE_2983_length_7620_cov_73.890271_3_plen_86_part_00
MPCQRVARSHIALHISKSVKSQGNSNSEAEAKVVAGVSCEKKYEYKIVLCTHLFAQRARDHIYHHCRLDSSLTRSHARQQPRCIK